MIYLLLDNYIFGFKFRTKYWTFLPSSQKGNFGLEKKSSKNKRSIKKCTLTSSPCDQQSSNTSDNVNKIIEIIRVNNDSEFNDCPSNDKENLYKKNLQVRLNVNGHSHWNETRIW